MSIKGFIVLLLVFLSADEVQSKKNRIKNQIWWKAVYCIPLLIGFFFTYLTFFFLYPPIRLSFSCNSKCHKLLLFDNKLTFITTKNCKLHDFFIRHWNSLDLHMYKQWFFFKNKFPPFPCNPISNKTL